MVLPQSTEELATTINIITDKKCTFGIRGGGHGTHALSNSLEKGVTIDMGKFLAPWTMLSDICWIFFDLSSNLGNRILQ